MKTKANWKQTLAENIAMDFERVAEANGGTMTDEWVLVQAINAYGTFLSEADLVTVAANARANYGTAQCVKGWRAITAECKRRNECVRFA